MCVDGSVCDSHTLFDIVYYWWLNTDLYVCGWLCVCQSYTVWHCLLLMIKHRLVCVWMALCVSVRRCLTLSITSPVVNIYEPQSVMADKADDVSRKECRSSRGRSVGLCWPTSVCFTTKVSPALTHLTAVCSLLLDNWYVAGLWDYSSSYQRCSLVMNLLTNS